MSLLVSVVTKLEPELGVHLVAEAREPLLDLEDVVPALGGGAAAKAAAVSADGAVMASGTSGGAAARAA